MLKNMLNLADYYLEMRNLTMIPPTTRPMISRSIDIGQLIWVIVVVLTDVLSSVRVTVLSALGSAAVIVLVIVLVIVTVVGGAPLPLSKTDFR